MCPKHGPQQLGSRAAVWKEATGGTRGARQTSKNKGPALVRHESSRTCPFAGTRGSSLPPSRRSLSTRNLLMQHISITNAGRESARAGRIFSSSPQYEPTDRSAAHFCPRSALNRSRSIAHLFPIFREKRGRRDFRGALIVRQCRRRGAGRKKARRKRE